MADEVDIVDPQIDCQTGDGYPECLVIGKGNLLEEEGYG